MDKKDLLESIVQVAGVGLMGIATAILAKAQSLLHDVSQTLERFSTTVQDFRDEVRDLRAEVRELRDLNDEHATRTLIAAKQETR